MNVTRTHNAQGTAKPMAAPAPKQADATENSQSQEDYFASYKYEKAKDVLKLAGVGALSGAATGALGGDSGWSVAIGAGTSATTLFGATYMDPTAHNHPLVGDLALYAAPIGGAITGVLGGAAGFALTNGLGMNPIVAHSVSNAVVNAGFGLFD